MYPLQVGNNAPTKICLMRAFAVKPTITTFIITVVPGYILS